MTNDNEVDAWKKYPPSLIYIFWIGVLVFVIGIVVAFWHPLVGAWMMVCGSLCFAGSLIEGEKIYYGDRD